MYYQNQSQFLQPLIQSINNGGENLIIKGMIIKCSSHIKEERSISSIYYLLSGKRSIQTVQDAHLYELDRYYGIFKKLNKLHFDKIIQELVDQQLLTIPSESTSTSKPTMKGMNWLTNNQNHLRLSYFNGLLYHDNDVVFLERLFLLIQVLTNSKMKHTSYIPVIDRPSATRWVKFFYRQIRSQVDHQLKGFYDELSELLVNFSESEAEMFVDRLTGFQHYGMSIHQLAEQYKFTVDDVQVLLIGITHRMLDLIRQDIDKFPLLAKITEDLSADGFITHSANVTYGMIKNGYGIDEIIQRRRLKTNTIYDHIVEIALYDLKFPICSYVSKEKQREIVQAVQETNTSKLKKIKDKVSEDISYFQIRLTLTSINNSLKRDDQFGSI